MNLCNHHDTRACFPFGLDIVSIANLDADVYFCFCVLSEARAYDGLDHLVSSMPREEYCLGYELSCANNRFLVTIILLARLRSMFLSDSVCALTLAQSERVVPRSRMGRERGGRDKEHILH